MAPRSRRYLRLLFVGLVLWMVLTKLPYLFLRLSFSMNITNTANEDASTDRNSKDDREVAQEKLLLERDAFEGYAPSPVKKARGRHTYRSDGLLEVNPKGPHPIFELVNNAEKAWNEKLRKASTSLDEAIGEYRRRYRRNPPKGFDKWYVP